MTRENRNLKLELTWVGKDHRPRLEPRILMEEKGRDYTATSRLSDNDQFDNMLIFGDNLLALKALSTDEKVKGQVKCIFIDPHIIQEALLSIMTMAWSIACG